MRKNTLDEATSSDCACGVLASLDHPKSSVLTGSDRHSLLEHSLPVATALVESLDHPKSCVLLSTTPAKTQDDPWVDDFGGTLRTLTTGSERSSGVFPSLGHHQSCVLLTKTPAKTQDHPWVDVSQPSLRTLTTGSERSNRERPSLPVYLNSTIFLYILNPQITTGSERSKGSTLTEFPIHYR